MFCFTDSCAMASVRVSSSPIACTRPSGLSVTRDNGSTPNSIDHEAIEEPYWWPTGKPYWWLHVAQVNMATKNNFNVHIPSTCREEAQSSYRHMAH